MVLIFSCKPPGQVEVPYYNEASFTPLWLKDKTKTPELHKISSYRVTNQQGKILTDRDQNGKITLVNFFFTACQEICPKMIKTMKTVQKEFPENEQVSFLSYSVTPDDDDVKTLYKYAQTKGIPAQQWNLVTGNKAEIYKLARESYFIEEEPGLSKTLKQFLHTENLVLVDGKGHIRGLYNGTLEAEVPRINEDIRALLAEE